MNNTPHVLPTMVSLTDALSDKEERPYTIPALKEWHAGDTSYSLASQSRILLAQALETTGAVLADDIQLLTGLRLPVMQAAIPQPGDIVLALDPAIDVPGAEGYVLEIAASIQIRAASELGIFNGTRTVLQLLRQETGIRGGVARDWPDYPERSLMVDMGRKYFSLAWLENHIRDLAYLKYNYFHFHLSDNYGFRLESERHPEIVSPEHYTKAEIRALIALARRYQITIVPEIDMPGHMDAILAHHPELQLVSTNGKRRAGDIDLSKDASYQLMRDLLEEYLPLFPGPYWHIGADEYIMLDKYEHYPQLLAYARQQYGPAASPKDTYLAFVNWANEIVKAHGKTTRAWNDGLHGGMEVTVADDIIYEHWHRSALEPQEIVALNLSIMNGNADYLYYVLGNEDYWRARPDVLYGRFEPQIFHGPATLDLAHPRQLGAKLHVWCDNPVRETEEQIAEGIECSLRALAQKNWGSAALVPDYTGFLPIIKLIGRAPGYVMAELPLAQLSQVPTMTAPKADVALSDALAIAEKPDV